MLLAKLLLENGAHPNDVNESKDISLRPAARYRRPGVARLLVYSGADAILPNDNMMTPLHFAAKPGNVNLVNFLWKTGPVQRLLTKRRTHHIILLLQMAIRR
jgi:ankyrin repeat protein